MSDREEAKKLFDEGLSPTEISEQLKVSAGTIRSWKNRDGWDGNNVEADCSK